MKLLYPTLLLGVALLSGAPRIAQAMATVIYHAEVSVVLRDAAGRPMPYIQLQRWHDDEPSRDSVTDGAGRAHFRYGYSKAGWDRAGKAELSLQLRFRSAYQSAPEPFLPFFYRFDLRRGESSCAYVVFSGDHDYAFGENGAGTDFPPRANRPLVLSRPGDELPGNITLNVVTPRKPRQYLENPRRWVDGDLLGAIDVFDCKVQVRPGENRVLAVTLELRHLGRTKVGGH